jgi:hypothetical protein
VAKFLERYKNCSSKKIELFPKDTARIERLVKEYTVPMFLPDILIRKELDFDTSGTSNLDNRKRQLDEAKEFFAHDMVFSRALKFASGESLKRIQKIESDVISELTKRAEMAKSEENANRAAKAAAYAEHLEKGLSVGHVTDTVGYTYTVTPFDAEGMKRELELMVSEAGAQILYHAMVTGADVQDGKARYRVGRIGKYFQSGLGREIFLHGFQGIFLHPESGVFVVVGAAGVIAVGMGQNHIGDIRRRKTQPCQGLHRLFVGVEGEARHGIAAHIHKDLSLPQFDEEEQQGDGQLYGFFAAPEGHSLRDLGCAVLESNDLHRNPPRRTGYKISLPWERYFFQGISTIWGKRKGVAREIYLLC